jgi:hypothetical protein
MNAIVMDICAGVMVVALTLGMLAVGARVVYGIWTGK